MSGGEVFSEPARDPGRIAGILAKITDVWMRHPDWRLGQLVVAAAVQGGHTSDPFYVEDDAILAGLDALPDTESIECPVCERRSWNPNDIRERYCGSCHAFHDDLSRRMQQIAVALDPLLPVGVSRAGAAKAVLRAAADEKHAGEDIG